MAKKSQVSSKGLGVGGKMGNVTEEYGSKYGAYLFLLGVVVALIVGVFSSVDTVKANLPTILGVLALLGLIVGLLNVTAQESDSFLIATIALMATATSLVPALLLVLTVTPQLSPMVDAISGLLSALAVFVAPAAVVVSLRSIYHLASNR
ncbi:MAG: hypothetical protein ABII22_06550 [Candidatus Micrarchaeota archaeon]